jgi:tetratricopeptide (TPR) repeat protein
VDASNEAPEPLPDREQTEHARRVRRRVRIPVTADDVTRHKRRVHLWVWVAVAAMLLMAGYLYKRSVDRISARESYEGGLRLYTVARYPQAILAFDRAVSLAPNMADGYLMRGRAYAGDGKIDRAIADFGKAIEARPGDTQALLGRGRCWLELKDFRAAIADADRAIAVDSRFSAAYNLRGVSVRGLGDAKKAIPDLTRAIELSPDSFNYFQRGATYQMLGEHRLALEDFDQMIAIQPDAASAYFARAESRLAVGDLRGAEQDRTQGRILDGR